MNKLGPVNEPLVVDNFLFEDVNESKCSASKCKNIGAHLMGEVSDNPQAKYLAICVPCYNETVDDLLKTLISLMQNIDFMQRTVSNLTSLQLTHVSCTVCMCKVTLQPLLLLTSLFQTKLYGDDPGQKLKEVFMNTIPVIVPIFDGTKALSPSMRRWIALNFKGETFTSN